MARLIAYVSTERSGMLIVAPYIPHLYTNAPLYFALEHRNSHRFFSLIEIIDRISSPALVSDSLFSRVRLIIFPR